MKKQNNQIINNDFDYCKVLADHPIYGPFSALGTEEEINEKINEYYKKCEEYEILHTKSKIRH